MFKKILIANRGEIACRIIRSAHKLGITTLAIYSEADDQALHTKMADEKVLIGPAPASQSYLLADKIIEIAKEHNADAIHPGYGFLSENMDFARKAEKAKIAFIGPHPKAIELMGDKIISKQFASKAGVSIIPGYQDAIEKASDALKIAKDIGFPVMIKAAAGGGGKGMRVAFGEADLKEGFGAAGREAQSAFGDGRVFIEKYIETPRHIEIQILCDKHGQGVYLGERECSIQRRNQKVIEESPSSFLTDEIRQKMGEEALALAKAVKYDSAGTVEFVMGAKKDFYFLEMNTRLQVEHPVTEMVYGVDLVEEMIRIAYGEKLRYQQSDIQSKGWAMESRLYAEDPKRNFLPSIGRLSWFRPPNPQNIAADYRLDSGVEEGDDIPIFYDPMIAKLITYADNREDAITKMSAVLECFRIEGIGNNLAFLNAIFNHPDFIKGDIDTGFIARFWPDGFAGVDFTLLQKQICAGVALFIHLKEKERAFHMSGARLLPEESDPLIRLENQKKSDIFEPIFSWGNLSHTRLDIENIAKSTLHIQSDWQYGQKIWIGTVNEQNVMMQIEKTPKAISLFYKGGQAQAMIRRKEIDDMTSLLPEREDFNIDTELLCPMPGQVTQIHVKEGDEVVAGTPLLTIEAMKMENILRAENDVIVKKINCEQGQNLGFEYLVMEFEIKRKS